MRRFVLSTCLILLAIISGVAMSFSPATATAVGSSRYVSLGDSVGAGMGLAAMPQQSPEDKACGRSSQAYAAYVAKAVSLPLEQIACNEAKAKQGMYEGQQVNNKPVEAQIDKAFAAGTPDLMTVTIGANDSRWLSFVQSCFVWSCGLQDDELLSEAFLPYMRGELHSVLDDIQAKSGSGLPPPVFFTGYYTPLSEANPLCDDVRNFNESEMVWLRNRVAALNQAIYDEVSQYAFATYVPVDFTGHELCSEDPWVQGVKDGAPFHPTAEGQKVIARSVVATVRSAQSH